MQTNTQTIPFINRLIGSDDREPHLINSPYTTKLVSEQIARIFN